MGLRGKHVDVTPSEMMELRNQGYSNHDIAQMLEVGISTVVRYIGKQGRRMERCEAFKDKPKLKAKESAPPIEVYSPKAVSEKYNLNTQEGDIAVGIDYIGEVITVDTASGSVCLGYGQAQELTRFLVWLSQKMRKAGEGTE